MGNSWIAFTRSVVIALFLDLTLAERGGGAPRPRGLLLWDEVDAAQASANLSKTLYHLPAVVKPWVEANRTAIGLRLPAAATVDVQRFTELHRCAMTPGFTRNTRRLISQALDPPGRASTRIWWRQRDGFARWLDDERRRYRDWPSSRTVNCWRTMPNAKRLCRRFAMPRRCSPSTKRMKQPIAKFTFHLFVRLGQPDDAVDAHRTCCQSLQDAMGAMLSGRNRPHCGCAVSPPGTNLT